MIGTHMDAAPAVHRTCCCGLTSRERQVIEGILRAESNHRIATSLSLSPGTVKYHLSRIYTKLRVGGRVQLAALVIKTRFVEMETPGRLM
jgi:DNA-binding NarL/FixJ family response regulator